MGILISLSVVNRMNPNSFTNMKRDSNTGFGDSFRVGLPSSSLQIGSGNFSIRHNFVIMNNGSTSQKDTVGQATSSLLADKLLEPEETNLRPNKLKRKQRNELKNFGGGGEGTTKSTATTFTATSTIPSTRVPTIVSHINSSLPRLSSTPNPFIPYHSQASRDFSTF